MRHLALLALRRSRAGVKCLVQLLLLINEGLSRAESSLMLCEPNGERMEPADTLTLPPVVETTENALRRVGVEIEFMGLEAQQAAAIVRAAVDGRTVRISDYEFVVETADCGDWKVERDQQLLKEMGRQHSSKEQLTFMESAAEAALRAGSRALVPLELVGPPLPMAALEKFQKVVDALAGAGAIGTQDSVFYAFGLQFNPELPALDAATITRYLQAFCCLQDWLFDRANVDTSRQLTLYADPFASAYIRKIIAPQYAPSLETLIDDYLADNPTRNRALDMLPLFSHLDADRVQRVVDDPRVKPRPTFHYRLPNSEVGRTGWSIYTAWSDWVVVEELANSDDRLAELCERYARHLGQPLGGILSSWQKDVAEWLTAHRE